MVSQQDVEEYLSANTGLQASMVVSPDNAASAIHKTLGGSKLTAALSENIAELVDIFCCLFELERVGLRLTALDGAMCPRFHVDRGLCALAFMLIVFLRAWLLPFKVLRLNGCPTMLLIAVSWV